MNVRRNLRPLAALPGLFPRRSGLLICLAVGIASACTHVRPPSSTESASTDRQIVVTATAYNSTVAQTDATPTVTAHGVNLEAGMQVIAISRDLEAMGLRPGTRVVIEGLPGEWTVADRMARRWRRRIDVYMGLDVARALRFGRREVNMTWDVPAQ